MPRLSKEQKAFENRVHGIVQKAILDIPINIMKITMVYRKGEEIAKAEVVDETAIGLLRTFVKENAA